MYSITGIENCYVHTKNKILKMYCNQSLLEELKVHFKTEINSNRMFDRIQNIEDLIKILEKRDVLSRENLSPLVQIQTFLESHSNIPNIPNSQVECCPNSQPMNNYQPSDNNFINNYPPSTPTNQRISCDPEVKHKVYKKIATEIGRKWMNLAREMQVREHIIDEYDKHYTNTEEKVYRVLRFHEENCDPKYWKFLLCKSLDNARRSDLRVKIQEIFAMHNM